MSNFFSQNPETVVGEYIVKYPQGDVDEVVPASQGLSPRDIKERLSEIFSELSTATINITGKIITFTLKQGSKN